MFARYRIFAQMIIRCYGGRLGKVYENSILVYIIMFPLILATLLIVLCRNW